MLSVIFCLPCVVCLAWTIIFKIRKCNPQQKLLMHILIFAAFYFMNFALFASDDTDYVMASRCDIVNVFVMPTLMGLLVIYVHALNKGKMMPMHKRIVILVPGVIQTAVIAILYLLVGVENAAKIFCHEEGYVRHGLVTITQLENSPFFQNELEKIFYIFDEFVVTFVVFLYAVALTIMSLFMSLRRGYRPGDCIRFWFFKKVTTPPRSITFSMLGVMVSLAPIITFGTSYIAKNVGVALYMCFTISFWIFLLSYIQFFDNLKSFTLYDLTHVDIFAINHPVPNQNETNTSKPVEPLEPMKSLEPLEPSTPSAPMEPSNPTSKPSPTPNLDYFLESLSHVMEVNHAYKDPNLTRDSLAQMISSNRTTLSAILNYSYGMNFKTYIATIRIEKAKEYLCANPEESLDIIAHECGFKDATSFSHKFKDIVGESPKVWIMSQ